MGGFGTSTPRSLQTAAKIHRLLSETLARGVVGRSSALQDGRAIAINRVEITSNLQLARVHWEPMGGDAPVRKLSAALERKRGFLGAHVNSFLRQKFGTRLEFVLDEQAAAAAGLDTRPRRQRERAQRREAAAQRLEEAFRGLQLTGVAAQRPEEAPPPRDLHLAEEAEEERGPSPE